VIEPFTGDWHVGADIYKTWRATWLKAPTKLAWVKDVHAWFWLNAGAATTTPKGRIHRRATDRQHRRHGRPKHPRGMGKWKAKNASHLPTPPTTATGSYLTPASRYTNTQPGTNCRVGRVPDPVS
jgi:hypothetical protein